MGDIAGKVPASFLTLFQVKERQVCGGVSEEAGDVRLQDDELVTV
jgi:hypothetical protein